MKDFEHAQQNASVNQFRPFEEDVTELTKTKPGYEVSKITIPVAGIFSEDDEACTASVNQLRMVDIPGFTSTTHTELYIDHVGIIADNSAFTIGSIKEYLSDMAIAVENTLLCPIEPVEPEEEKEPEEENWDCEIRLLSSDSDSGSGSDSDSSNSDKKKKAVKRCVKKNKKKSGSSNDSSSDIGSDSSSDNKNWKDEEVEVVIVIEEDEPFHGDDEYTYLDDEIEPFHGDDEYTYLDDEVEPFHGDDEYSYLDDLALQQQQLQAEELRLAQETQAARKRPTKGKKA